MRRAAIVRALAAAILAERWPTSGRDPSRQGRVAARALAQADRAPDVMRWPLAILLHVFDAAPLVRRGRRFARLDLAAQADAVRRWRDARIGVLRSFVRYWESVVILAWYAEDEDRGG
jgi:hypothetical protein